MKRGPVQYVVGILLGLDETLNAVFAGNPHQSISARSWQAKEDGKAWGKIAVWIIDHLFFPGHCQQAWNSENP